MSFAAIKTGDTVTRILAGLPMTLKVTDVDDDFIYCGPKGVGWKFRRDNGAEVDEELGWGLPTPSGGFTPTGSFLVAEHGQVWTG